MHKKKSQYNEATTDWLIEATEYNEPFPWIFFYHGNELLNELFREQWAFLMSYFRELQSLLHAIFQTNTFFLSQTELFLNIFEDYIITTTTHFMMRYTMWPLWEWAFSMSYLFLNNKLFQWAISVNCNHSCTWYFKLTLFFIPGWTICQEYHRYTQACSVIVILYL